MGNAQMMTRAGLPPLAFVNSAGKAAWYSRTGAILRALSRKRDVHF
jgi:hypothetical protein